MNSTNGTVGMFCEEVEQKCNPIVSAILLSANIPTVVINLIHLLTTYSMTGLHKSNYYWVILQMTLADIVVSLATAISASFWFQNTMTQYGNHVFSVVFGVIYFGTVQCRYTQLMLANVHRYYAICKPFDYETSKIPQNIGKLLLAGWIFNMIVCLTTAVASPESICFEYIIKFGKTKFLLSHGTKSINADTSNDNCNLAHQYMERAQANAEKKANDRSG